MRAESRWCSESLRQKLRGTARSVKAEDNRRIEGGRIARGFDNENCEFGRLCDLRWLADCLREEIADFAIVVVGDSVNRSDEFVGGCVRISGRAGDDDTRAVMVFIGREPVQTFAEN